MKEFVKLPRWAWSLLGATSGWLVPMGREYKEARRRAGQHGMGGTL